MGDGTAENPYTREDVLRLIRKNHGEAKGLDLSEKIFNEEIDLCDLNLKGIILNKAELIGARFNGSNLSEAKLIKAKLVRAKFNQYGNKPLPKFANLREADLSGSDLNQSEFIGAFLDYTKFNEATLEEVNFSIKGRREPDLLHTDFRKANLCFSDFTGRSFFFTKLEGAFLYWAKITESSFLGRVDWGNYKLGEEDIKNYLIAEHRYRQLKQWYTKAGYYDIAGEFYYREREARRKSLKWISRNWHHRLVIQISYLVFGHGERWRRIPLWMLFSLIIFAITYYFGGNLDAINSLYFSAVSFTALGYGHWVVEPTGWVKLLGAIEAFLGIFMMALFLVTIVRRWAR